MKFMQEETDKSIDQSESVASETKSKMSANKKK